MRPTTKEAAMSRREVSNDADIEKIVTSLRDRFNVAYVAPGHCTGEPHASYAPAVGSKRGKYPAAMAQTVERGVRTVASA
jgi:hypothetical protein